VGQVVAGRPPATFEVVDSVWPLPDESGPLEPECDDVADEGVERAPEGLSYERLMLRGNVECWKRRASLSPSPGALARRPRRVSVEVVALKIMLLLDRSGHRKQPETP
jgi:hypothetical protein